MSAMSDGKPIVVESIWDKANARYDPGELRKVAPASLGTARFVGEGGDAVPAFETDIEPIRSLAITAPREGATVADEDLVVRWETDELAAGGVQIRLGGWSEINCGFGAAVRSLIVPRELVRAALASRDEQLSADYQMMVYLVRGKRFRVGDFEVSANIALIDGRSLTPPP